MTGSKNFKSSAVNNHSQRKLHKRALRLEEEEQAKLENKICHIVQERLSKYAPIVQAVGKKEDKNAVKKLLDISYLIAIKGCLYSDFKDLVELE